MRVEVERAGVSLKSKVITVKCAPADVSMTKTNSNASPGFGQSFFYTLTVSNGGQVTANGVTVSDAVPAEFGVTSVSTTSASPGACTSTGNQVECTGLVIAPGSAITVTINVNGPAASDCGKTSVNRATSNEVTGSASDSPGVATPACTSAVTMTKTEDAANPAPIGIGFDYTLTLTNTGFAAAAGVTVSDQVPSQFDVTGVAESSATGTCGESSVTPNLVECSNLTVPAKSGGTDGQVTVTITVAGPVASDCGQTFTNTASSSVTPDASAPVTTAACTSAVTMTKTASDTTPAFGQAFSYVITMTNSGYAAAAGGSLLDAVDDAFDVTSVASTSGTCTEANNVVSCSGLIVPARSGANDGVATVTINVAGPTSADCGQIIPNTAVYNGIMPGASVDVVTPACPPNNPTPTTPGTLTPAIQVTKVASAPNPDIGGTIVYTYVVKNVGELTLSTVTLTDDKLGDITLPVGILNPGGQATVTASHVITAQDMDAGAITNVATTTGLTAGGTPVTDTDTVRVTLPQRPAVAVEKTADVEFAELGDTINYTYVITNSGNVTLSRISLVDDKVPGVFDDALSDTLAAGESMVITGTYNVGTADVDEGQVTNVAVARGYFPVPDLAAAGHDDGPTNHVEATDTVTVPVGKTVVEGTGFITVNKGVVGEPGDNGYAFTVDCGAFALGDRNQSFTIAPEGGSKEIGVAVPTGTTCTITEVRDGGADSTTVQHDDGKVIESNTMELVVEDGTTDVNFVNTFDVAPIDREDRDPDPRPLVDPEPEPKKKPTLPATGTDANIQLLLGLAAIAMGGTMVRVGRPKRRTGWLRG